MKKSVSLTVCASGSEILAKISKNMKVWFSKLNFGPFRLISQEAVQVFQNQFCVETLRSSLSF